MLREVLAPNASAMTLDGTRTFIIGRERVAVLDPGSPDPAHLDAVADLVGDGVCVGILITHGHPDHAAGADTLATRLRTRVRASFHGGERIETDAGALVAVKTPGHTRDHTAFHWPAADAVFCGDLMMGGLDTALVASPEGDLADYLDSLERVRALRPRVIHPAHGPSFHEPDSAIDGYIAHRRERRQQVLRALDAGATSVDALVDHVYGDALPAEFRGIARGAIVAWIEHLERT